jgi:hypothetical protein
LFLDFFGRRKVEKFLKKRNFEKKYFGLCRKKWLIIECVKDKLVSKIQAEVILKKIII